MDRKLLELLVCPKSGSTLELNKKTNELWCKASGLAYPIENDIPIMLVEKARNLTNDEKQG